MTSLTPKPSQVESWDRLPSDWQNDERMDALFSFFKDRDLNPVHYDAKMKFWSETIIAYCEDHGLLQIDMPTVVSRFRRKGKTPKCLEKIFDELIKQNRLISTNDYANSQQSSWMSWTFNKLASPLTSWMSPRTPIDQDVFIIKEIVDVRNTKSFLFL
jgi:charged multivesicular body protein 7